MIRQFHQFMLISIEIDKNLEMLSELWDNINHEKERIDDNEIKDQK